MTKSMTQGSASRTRTFVVLSDILSLRLECAKCQSSLTIPRIDRKNAREKSLTRFGQRNAQLAGRTGTNGGGKSWMP
jgi:hypothetical protein